MTPHDRTQREACDDQHHRALARLTRQIVVGLAGPEPSMSPLRLALDLAEPAGGAVDLLVTSGELAAEVLPFGHSMAVAAWARRGDLARRKEADAWVSRGIKLASDREVLFSARRTRAPLLQLLEQAAGLASMLVLQRQAPGAGVDEPLLTVAGKLVRRTRRPVLLAARSYRRPARVVVAYVGKPLGLRVLGRGAALARGLDLPLVVFSAGDQRLLARAARDARRELEALGAAASYRGWDAPAAAALTHQARADTLLVMGAHGRGGLRRLVMGSVTEQVIRGAAGPVLLIPRARETDSDEE